MDEKQSIIKIGPKRLEEEAIKKILPNYKDIFIDIKNMRKTFKNANACEEINNKYKSEEYHDNVISILGNRGSGKSSVLKTIEQELTQKINWDKENKNDEFEDYSNDIILPIIMPEIMESNDLIGWLIGYFKEIVDKEVLKFQRLTINEKDDVLKKTFKNLSYNKIHSENFEACCNSRVLKCPILKSYNDWVLAYANRSNDFREIFKINYLGEDEYREDFITHLNSDVNILSKFQQFINAFIIYIEVSNNCKNPIIYILFDDLDLIPYNSVKMLETIMIYLSQSNIITFITGDYYNFEERMLLNYLRKDEILNTTLYMEKYSQDKTHINARDDRKQLAYDFLKKLLTPAYRYKLKKYNLKECKEFHSGEYNREKINNKSLEVVLNEYSSKLKNRNSLSNELDSEFYFEIFDTKPRGLINVYKYVVEAISKIDNLVKQSDLNERQILLNKNLEEFIELILVCKDDYNLYLEDLKQSFDVSLGFHGDFIKYNNIEDLANRIYSDSKTKEQRCLTIQKILKFYYLGFFLEIMIGTKIKFNEKLHVKQVVKKNFVNWLKKYVNIYLGETQIEVFDTELFEFENLINTFVMIENKIGFSALANVNKDIDILRRLITIFGEVNSNELNNKNYDDNQKFEIGIKWLEEKSYENYSWTKQWFVCLINCKKIRNKNNKTYLYNTHLEINKLKLTKQEYNIFNELSEEKELGTAIEEIKSILYPNELLKTLKESFHQQVKVRNDIYRKSGKNFIKIRSKLDLKDMIHEIISIYYSRFKQKYKIINPIETKINTNKLTYEFSMNYLLEKKFIENQKNNSSEKSQEYEIMILKKIERNSDKITIELINLINNKIIYNKEYTDKIDEILKLTIESMDFRNLEIEEDYYDKLTKEEFIKSYSLNCQSETGKIGDNIKIIINEMNNLLNKNKLVKTNDKLMDLKLKWLNDAVKLDNYIQLKMEKQSFCLSELSKRINMNYFITKSTKIIEFLDENRQQLLGKLITTKKFSTQTFESYSEIKELQNELYIYRSTRKAKEILYQTNLDKLVELLLPLVFKTNIENNLIEENKIELDDKKQMQKVFRNTMAQIDSIGNSKKYQRELTLEVNMELNQFIEGLLSKEQIKLNKVIFSKIESLRKALEKGINIEDYEQCITEIKNIGKANQIELKLDFEKLDQYNVIIKAMDYQTLEEYLKSLSIISNGINVFKELKNEKKVEFELNSEFEYLKLLEDEENYPMIGQINKNLIGDINV